MGLASACARASRGVTPAVARHTGSGAEASALSRLSRQESRNAGGASALSRLSRQESRNAGQRPAHPVERPAHPVDSLSALESRQEPRNAGQPRSKRSQGVVRSPGTQAACGGQKKSETRASPTTRVGAHPVRQESVRKRQESAFKARSAQIFTLGAPRAWRPSVATRNGGPRSPALRQLGARS